MGRARAKSSKRMMLEWERLVRRHVARIGASELPECSNARLWAGPAERERYLETGAAFAEKEWRARVWTRWSKDERENGFDSKASKREWRALFSEWVAAAAAADKRARMEPLSADVFESLGGGAMRALDCCLEALGRAEGGKGATAAVHAVAEAIALGHESSGLSMSGWLLDFAKMRNGQLKGFLASESRAEGEAATMANGRKIFAACFENKAVMSRMLGESAGKALKRSHYWSKEIGAGAGWELLRGLAAAAPSDPGLFCAACDALLSKAESDGGDLSKIEIRSGEAIRFDALSAIEEGLLTYSLYAKRGGGDSASFFERGFESAVAMFARMFASPERERRLGLLSGEERSGLVNRCQELAAALGSQRERHLLEAGLAGAAPLEAGEAKEGARPRL